MSSTQVDPAAFPDTILAGKGITITFLRNEPYLTRAHISGAPDTESFYAPPHWHATHDEIHRVLLGRLEFTIGGITRTYGPDDGETFIPRGVVHSIRGIPGVETIVEERTEPMDDEKELVFRNLFAHGSVFVKNPLEAMNIMYYGDGFPALPGGFRWLDRLVVVLLGYYLAPLFGCQRTYESLKKM